MADIYVLRDNQQFGPYGQDTVAVMLEKGQFSSTDSYWHEGMTEWRPLAEFSSAPVNTIPRSTKPYPLKKDWRSSLFREVSPGWVWIICGLLLFGISFFGFAPGVYGRDGHFPFFDFFHGEFRSAKRLFNCIFTAAMFIYGIFVVVGGSKKRK